MIAGASWLFIAKVSINLIGLVSTVILARLLMPEDFGLVAIASSLAMIVAMITELSLSQALIQSQRPTKGHYDTAFTLNLIRGIALAAIVGALGWPLSIFYGDDRLLNITLVLAIGVFAGGLVNPKMSDFERTLDYKKVVVLGLVEKLGGFFLTIFIAIYYQSYWALVLGQLSSQVFKSLVSFYLKPYRPSFSLSHAGDLLSFSLWLTFGQTIQALAWRADPLIIGYFLSPRSLGQFSMGGRVAGLAISDTLYPVTQILFPALAQLKDSPDRIRSAYLRAQGLLNLLGIPLATGLAVLAAKIVGLMLGSNWNDAVMPLQFLAIAAVLPRIVSVDSAAMANGNTRALFYRDVRVLFIRLPLVLGGLVFAPWLGYSSIFGALVGILAASLINLSMNMMLLAKISHVSVNDQLSIMWRPVLASAVMALVVSTTSAMLPSGTTWTFHLISLIALAAIGVSCYLLTLSALWIIGGTHQGAETEAAAILSGAISAARARSSFFRRR